MPMLEGAVIVDPLTGSTSGFGMVKEAFDVIDAATNYGDFSGSDLAVAKEGNANIARAIGKVILHVQTNAQVTTSVAPGIPVATAGTAAAQTGATTAPGAGSGTVA